MSKRRLLLADDSVTIQKVVNLTFADEGIEVIAVGDGDAAMEKFVEAVPDLVMVDVNMPGFDGYRICEIIKQDETTKHIPVILLVGSFEPFSEEEARRVGADGFLTKPFQSIRHLLDKVNNLLEGKTEEDNFLVPIENAAASVNNFVDVLDKKSADEFDTADFSTENFGDAGMDDEMIHTSQMDNPPDETHQFESEPIYESFAEDLDQTSLKPPYNSATLPATSKQREDRARTQPLTGKDLDEITPVADEKKTASINDLDDFELPDLPQMKSDTAADRIGSQTVSESSNQMPETSDVAAGEISDWQAEDLQNPPQAESLSPELVEAIADKVAEKISKEVITTIVREVIAQMNERK